MNNWFSRQPNPRRRPSGPAPRRFSFSLLLLLATVGTLLLAQAQLQPPILAQQNLQRQEDQLIRQFSLPKAPTQAPVYRPQPAPVYQPPAPAPAAPQAPTSSTPAPAPASPAKTEPAAPVAASPAGQYVLEFNRSPVIGDRFRLQGVFSEARLGFTRPRNWDLQSVKAIIRYQHSPALLANRSNLTVRINGTSVGSAPLNQRQGQIGQLMVNIPPGIIRDFNEISVVAQQNNAECSNPADPTLWTEVLPDSKLLFGFQPRSVPLDFSRYPYPFFDTLGLDANRITYLLPSTVTDGWLTAATRFQAALGRIAGFRPLDSQVTKSLGGFEWRDRLVIIGTPEEQPALKSLKLPFAIGGNQVLDGSKSPLPEDVGVLMLTTTQNGSTPVLVATGNGPEGVAKAVQFLVQGEKRRLGTGQAMLVNTVDNLPTPDGRKWPAYLPTANSFKLSDLKTVEKQPFQDITVRGASAPPVEFDFRALPDDRFLRGSSMDLVYSYSPQVNPRTSVVEVLLDGVGIGGKRLDSVDGANRLTVNVNLPENLVKPNSKIQVFFRLNPREPGQCGVVTDQQLWGTVHSDTTFKLRRETSVELPDLKLLQFGFPFAAPQDLSATAIVLPDGPSAAEVQTALKLSERLGRLSQADSLKLEAYTTGSLTDPIRKERNLIGVGLRERFPLPEIFKASGFQLGDLFSRQWGQSQIQALPDRGGVIKTVLSPWNGNRVLLALMAQTESGLGQVQDILSRDPWFFRLQGDTALINTTEQNPSPYDPDAYQMEFLQQAPQRRIEDVSLLGKAIRFLQEHWYLLPTGIITLALLLYGIAQLYLKRMAGEGK